MDDRGLKTEDRDEELGSDGSEAPVKEKGVAIFLQNDAERLAY